MGAGLNKRLTDNERAVNNLKQQNEEIVTAHNATVQAMANMMLFIEWATSSMSEADFADFRGFAAERGVEIDRDPDIMMPEKRIFVPGG